MSVTVGAALKKIAVALLSDKKTLKKAAMAILVVIVALFMPMAAIITVTMSMLTQMNFSRSFRIIPPPPDGSPNGGWLQFSRWSRCW